MNTLVDTIDPIPFLDLNLNTNLVQTDSLLSSFNNLENRLSGLSMNDMSTKEGIIETMKSIISSFGGK